MSISNTVSRTDFVGNGATTSFAYIFKIVAASELTVITRSVLGVETTLTLNTDYTVTNVGNKTGGQVVFTTAPANNVKITILHRVPLTQNTDIRNQGDYYPEVIEDTFDKLTYIDQQQQDHLNRALTLPRTFTTTDFSPTLPTNIVGAASVVLATNPTGTGLVTGPTLGDINTAASLVPTVNAAVTAAGNSATAAATSATAAGTSATNAATSATQSMGYRDTALGYSNNAQTQANNATTSANLAKDWANKTSGNVDGVEYSAKYYAQVASATIANKVNRAGDTMTGALGIQNILRLEQEVNSASTGANVTLTPTRSNHKLTGAVVSIRQITPPASTDGALLVLTNGYSSSMTVQNLVGSAGAQIATGTGADVPLLSGGTIWLYYDNASTVWRVIGGTGGSGGSSLPNGGTIGQVLAKNSSTNGDVSWYTLDKTSVGLGNVDNTSDATKNAATATLTNKTLTSPVINSPTGLVKADVGLGNVDNTADVNKNVATAVSATNVTGTVAIANGGTGGTTRQAAINNLAGTQSAGSFLRSDGTNTALSAIQAADVPTLNQNTTGNAATATTAGNVTGTVAIANGGTGQTTRQAALNALAGTQTAATFLRSDGTNTSLTAIAASDVPTLNQNTTGTAANVTGVVAKANGGSGQSNASLTFPSTGTLATTAGTETFTNKTLTTPKVSDQIQFTALAATPTVPAAGAIAIYAKSADGRLYYQNNAGLEQPVQGPRVQKNYLLGGDGETGLGQTGAGYTDTAVPTSVVTGGTKRLTITSTLPLSGANSLLFTPIATIGGDAMPFSVDRGDFGQVLQGDITLELGGTGYVDGALQFWIVAPSGAVIQPAGTWSVNAFTGQSRVRFTFQTESTGTQYYLKVHQSTTVNTWTAKMEMTLVRQIVALGAFMSDWTSYTPTLTGFGTVTSLSAQSRRIGDTLFVKATFISGTVNATAATMTLGFNGVNGGLTTSSNMASTQLAGYAEFSTNNSTLFEGTVLATPGSQTVGFGRADNTTSSLNARPGNGVVASSSAVSLYFQVPIQGWGSSQVLSQDAGDGRLVSFSGNNGSNQSLTAGTTDMTITTGTDTTGSWNGTQFKVPTAGDYNIQLYAADAGGTAYTLQVFINGTAYRNIITMTANNGGISGSVLVTGARAGDLISIRSVQTATVGGRNLYIYRISTGNQQIAAGESVNFSANTSTTAASTTVPFVYSTVLKDSHGQYNATTGRYTIPSPGFYMVFGQIYVGSTSTTAYVYLNGTNVAQGVPPTSASQASAVTLMRPFITGDIIDIRPDAAATASGGAILNRFSIVRLGN